MGNQEQISSGASNQADPENLKLRIRYAPRSERYEMGKQLQKACPPVLEPFAGFSFAYADQNEKDYASLKQAIKED